MERQVAAEEKVVKAQHDVKNCCFVYMAFHSHRRHRSRSSSALEAVHVVRRVAAEILRRPLLLMLLVLLHAEILAHAHAVGHAAHVGVRLRI
jgi:hypothetical protein